MSMWIRSLVSLLLMIPSLHADLGITQAADETTQKEVGIHIVIETSEGDIEVVLHPDRAPLSVAQFLAHVDGDSYAGASFYRVSSKSRGSSIEVVQGGLLAHAMRESIEAFAQGDTALSPVAHETTDTTGMLNERGVLAFARLAPGTANSEFFFNMQDNPELDYGYTQGGRDGYGYATFGRVVSGMRVLEVIQQQPSDAPTPIELVRGQILEQPVEIQRIYRVAPQRD